MVKKPINSVSKKPISPVEEVNGKINQIKQNALLQQTTEAMQDAQLTLFDIAPWADDMRAMPNDFARSALFTVRNKRQEREAIQNKLLYHFNKDVQIHYTGIELRSDDDELVWQQVLEYAKRVPFGEKIGFSFYQLCQDLGWSINGRYYEKAENCLTRLKATALTIQNQRIGQLKAVSLIESFDIVERGTKKALCQVQISEQMVFLFAGEHYNKFVWEKYRKLTPIARRLFDYLASHKQPYPLKLETFRLMCGSDTARAAKWKEQSKSACEELTASGLVVETWVNGDSIYCDRDGKLTLEG